MAGRSTEWEVKNLYLMFSFNSINEVIYCAMIRNIYFACFTSVQHLKRFYQNDKNQQDLHNEDKIKAFKTERSLP